MIDGTAGPEKGAGFFFVRYFEAGIQMKTILVICLLLLLQVTAVAAKEGLYLGAFMLFNDVEGIDSQGNTISAGHGAGIKAGVGLNRYLAIEAGYWATDHDVPGGQSVDLKGYTLDIKIAYPVSDSHVEPYVVTGAGNYILDTSRGNGFHFGVGMDISLTPLVSFNAGWTKRTIDFGASSKISREVDSMEVGLAYHFP